MDQEATCVNDRRWAETAKERALIGGGGGGGGGVGGGGIFIYSCSARLISL